ncbi:ACT domain protein [Candidatus Anstonella stagnisolia]|nr:ACT domain protein [Candidatus Anstonella stagnisolia]
MATISNIGELLKKMQPELRDGKFYFCSVEPSQLMSLASLLDCVLCIQREKEGLSVVFSEDAKESMETICSKKIIGPFALITLNVHSDLLAVGFLAKITAALAKEGISANAMSAYHHDHLLVPYGLKGDAMGALKALGN